MHSISEAKKTVNDCKHTQMKEDIQIDSQASKDCETSMRHRLLQHSSKTNKCCKWSAGCLNGIYQVFGNIFQGGAVIGAGFLTVSDLSGGYKDGVGAMTIGLIIAGTFCFWQVSCCPHQNEESVTESLYSGVSINSQNKVRSDTDSDSESDSGVA